MLTSELYGYDFGELTSTRTIIKAMTVILASLALTLAGGEVLRSFSAAILFGITVGIYSSVYISVPVLIYLGLGEAAKDEVLVS